MRSRLNIERIPAPFASMYEKACRLVIERYYAPLAEEIVREFKEGRLLDLGTGPGYLPLEIVKRAPLVTAVGLDLSLPLVRRARKNAIENGETGRLRFEVGNAAKLGFVDNSFGRVISTGMLHMLKDPVKVLKESRRVLTQDGEAWIYDPARVSSQIDGTLWKTSFTSVEKWAYPFLSIYSRLNPPRVYTRAQLVSMIESASFKEYDIQGNEGEWRIKARK